jgi:hypothetical protein
MTIKISNKKIIEKGQGKNTNQPRISPNCSGFHAKKKY